jgi:hypothetical protein
MFVDNLGDRADRGAELTRIDPMACEMTRLFNPRSDDWPENFMEYPSVEMFGISVVERVSVDVIGANASNRFGMGNASVPQ